MSLIDDAIQLLSEFPPTQQAVRQLVSEHDALKSENRDLKTKSEHDDQKHDHYERQLDDIRALIKEPETPIHAPSTEEEKQQRLSEVFSTIEARAIKSLEPEHVELERTDLTVILQNSLSAGLDETIPKKE